MSGKIVQNNQTYAHISPLLKMLNFYLCLKSKVREREGESEGELFYLLVQSPSGHNCQSWAIPEPGSMSFTQVSQRVQGPKDLNHPVLLFQVINKELAQKWRN